MRLLPLILIALTLIGCTTSSGSPAASPQRESASPSVEPTPSASVATGEPSASAEPSATDTPDVLAVGTWVETTADRLKLREGPGLDAGSMGLLSVGSSGTVIEGPVVADGYSWYRLAWPGLPWGSGCATGPVAGGLLGCWVDGWLAGANAAGDPWLQASEPQCPDAPRTVEDLAIMQPGVRLACYGDADLTVVGYIAPEPGGRGCFPGYRIEPAWLHPCGLLYLQGTEIDVEGTGGPELNVSMHPDLGTCDFGGRTPPGCPFASYVGQWVEVVGHHDDPGSATCTVEPDQGNDFAPDDPLGRYMCRERFVVTAVGTGTAP